MATLRKPLSRQVLVITGATSGVGLAASRAAAKAGSRLVLGARDGEALTALAAELTAAGAEVAAVAGDLADEGSAKALADAADKAFGGFDTWVNNAGVSVYGRSWDVPLAEQKRVFEINYWGAVEGSLVAVARLKARPGGGTIINVGSVLSDQAIPLQAAYCASKHALKAFSNALRMELIRESPEIAVTLIKPSALDMPYSRHAASYLEYPAGNPPPVYDPALAAEAILYAAEHPVRELTVGGAGRALALIGQLLPGIAEPVMAHLIPQLSRDPAARAPLGLVRRTSLWSRAQMNPRTTAAAAVGAGTALLLFLKLRDGLRLAHARRQGREDALARIRRRAERAAAKAKAPQAA